MSKTVKVKRGDCLINLSAQESLPWDKVWQHPKNQELRNKRKDKLNILEPGDEVFIPDLEIKKVDCATEQTHHFVVEMKLVDFILTLLDLGRPRANEKYILKVAGLPDREGTTDDKGTLKEKIPATARRGVIKLGENQLEMEVAFGGIDPIEEISGVQTRLANLGFYHGIIGDHLDDMTTAAIAEFQRSVDLAGNGELTDETRKKLVEVHGS